MVDYPYLLKQREFNNNTLLKAAFPELWKILNMSVQPPTPGDVNPELWDPDAEEEEE